MDLSDEKLVSTYLAGDEKSLEFLIRRHFKAVYNFTAKFIGDRKEAEDLTQEIFLKIWKNLKKFDQTKNFRVWLFRIARNACVDHLRRKKAIVFSALDESRENNLADNLPDPGESIIERISRREFEEEINKALKNISEAGRTVLLLYYGQQMTFQEVADLLGEPMDTVKSRHRRALIALRKIFVRQPAGSGIPAEAPKLTA